MKTKSQWVEFFDRIISSESKHYLWLRSLSYLEYIGYRKMVKALEYQEVSRGVYHHLTDEIKHSYMLKELAEQELKYGGKAAFGKEFIDIAEAYFQDIDKEVKHWIEKETGRENPFICYTVVSYIIEKRAMLVYPNYFNSLRDTACKYIIQKIIADEREHLNYLEEHLKLVPELSSLQSCHLWDYEDSRFRRYLEEFSTYSA
jgi:bacterioferritin (cytochrome b1)